MMVWAQTNIQLYRQLDEAGYAPGAVERVAAGYELALRLFTGAYRASGKPFLAHLVGTASALAAVRARPAAVAAGLLHAAYDEGEWGNGWSGIAAGRQRELAAAVGADAEDLVARYHLLPWTAASVAGLRARLDAMPDVERDVVLMRLANDLDDHVDLGVLYCNDAEARRRDMRARRAGCVEMAESLGGAVLRDELAAVYDAVDKGDVPAALRRRQGSSYRVPPASHGLRPRIVLSHLLARKPLP